MATRKNKNQYRGGSRQSRPSYLQNPSRGMHAVLATCQRTLESRCCREMMQLLGDVIDQFWPESSSVDEDADRDGPMSIEDALERERIQLTKKTSSRLVQLDVGGVAGIVLIQVVDNNIDVVELVGRAFDYLQQANRALTRYVQRLIPVQCVFRASPGDLSAILPEFMQAQLQSRPGSESFCCMTESRCNDQLERSQAITLIAGAVIPTDRPVNLNEPDLIINLQVIKNVAGLSCFTRHDYNRCYQWKWRTRIESLLQRGSDAPK